MAIAASAVGAGALALIEALLPLVLDFQPAPVPSLTPLPIHLLQVIHRILNSALHRFPISRLQVI